MKRLLFFLLIFFLIASCKKTEFVGNDQMVRAALAAAPLPSVDKCRDVVVAGTGMKAADIVLIEVFPLAQETYTISLESAQKYLAYYELYLTGERKELMTIIQEFHIINGVLDTSQYLLRFELGCQFSRDFTVPIASNFTVWDTHCYFHFTNGQEFSYRIQGGKPQLKLPNLGNGSWEVTILTDDQDMLRNVTTGLIDYHGSDLLSLVIDAKYQNSIGKIVLKKTDLVDVSSIRIGNPKGDYLIAFHYNQDMPDKLYFDIPLVPTSIALVGKDFFKLYDPIVVSDGIYSIP